MLPISSVDHGHAVNWFLLMALTNVDFTGEKSAAWRNFTISAFVSFFLTITKKIGQVTWTCLKFEGSFYYNLSCLSYIYTK